jgi:hypothetical protein
MFKKYFGIPWHKSSQGEALTDGTSTDLESDLSDYGILVDETLINVLTNECNKDGDLMHKLS